jgi:hypothetical protein
LAFVPTTARIRPGASDEQRRIGRTDRDRIVLDPDVYEVQEEEKVNIASPR